MNDQDKMSELIAKLMDRVSDRNSCMTKLAESQIPLMEWLAKANINPGNDINGQLRKYDLVNEQVIRLDRMIDSLSVQDREQSKT